VSITVRRLWHLFKLAGTRVDLAAPPAQNEQLEGWTTYVCEAELADQPDLALGQSVRLAQVDFDAAQQAVQFRGIVDHIAVSSFEHRVVLTCTGPLARLRRVPTGDHDLTGMTDGQAVMHVLNSCNISYTAADIQDAGYVLGAQVPVIWHRDQPGWEIVRELDRVFGMATIEIGDGRIVRFAYDRAPGASLISRTFERGVDATFWRNERDYGALDAIQNVWQVTGASWDGADGCHYTVWARAEGANPAFDSPNVRVRRQDFSSEIIQDQALAEAVARRMMRWYNRQPDEVTIETLNDPNITPGDVVGVIDPVYGIGLTSAAPYLVLAVDRRGQEMTLSCVGGPAGSEGTVTSGVEKRCNKTTSNTTIPGSYSPPPVSAPPAVPLDPWSCATDGGPDWICPPSEVNTTDPYIGCEDVDGMAGSVPPEWVDGSGLASWQHVEDSQWRVVNDAGVSVHVDASGNVDEIRLHGNNPAFFWNDTPGTNAAKSAMNDRIIGAAPVIVVSGEVWFGATGQRLQIKLDNGTIDGDATVLLYADPGVFVSSSSEGTHYWAVEARSEHHAAQWSDSYPPGQCPHATTACNNGGRMGKDMGFATGMWIPFSIAFALGAAEQRVYVSAGNIAGYMEDFPCWPYPSPCWFSFGNTVCGHTHRLVISSTIIGGTPQSPGMKLRLLGMGHTTCQPNPDYVPPERGG
jgi:hypothetical protein